MNSLFDDMMKMNTDVEVTRSELKRKQTKIAKIVISSHVGSVDSLNTDTELAASAASPTKIQPEIIEEEAQKPASSRLSGATEEVEAKFGDLQPDMIPLMRKKTTVVQNLGDQQKFADGQYAINTELMAKNKELEERILAMEHEMRFEKEYKEELKS